MIEATFRITYLHGLHARPATMLVAKANSFLAAITLEFQERKINLKSIMGVLSLGVPQNASVKLIIDGSDEDDAYIAMKRVILDINAMN